MPNEAEQFTHVSHLVRKIWGQNLNSGLSPGHSSRALRIWEEVHKRKFISSVDWMPVRFSVAEIWLRFTMSGSEVIIGFLAWLRMAWRMWFIFQYLWEVKNSMLSSNPCTPRWHSVICSGWGREGFLPDTFILPGVLKMMYAPRCISSVIIYHLATLFHLNISFLICKLVTVRVT
jgi:hypothetical protein